jgi:hypothetical protein
MGIKRHFDQSANQFTAAVLACVTQGPEMEHHVLQVQQEATRWREPKAVIIFVFDKQEKMIRRDRQPLIDGTLLGPDHLAELVAWYLHGWEQRRRRWWCSCRMGPGGFGTVWTRLSGGLAWLNAPTRRAKPAELRGRLKHSRHAEVVPELERLAAGRPKKHKVWTEIR